ncbi:hypothetical protein ACLB2K_006276 [Fragaria x ananassa]
MACARGPQLPVMSITSYGKSLPNCFSSKDKNHAASVACNTWHTLDTQAQNLICLTYLRFYLQADEEVETRAKYLAMLQLSDPGQLCYWPSIVAASLVLLASLEGNDRILSEVTL